MAEYLLRWLGIDTVHSSCVLNTTGEVRAYAQLVWRVQTTAILWAKGDIGREIKVFVGVYVGGLPVDCYVDRPIYLGCVRPGRLEKQVVSVSSANWMLSSMELRWQWKSTTSSYLRATYLFQTWGGEG